MQNNAHSREEAPGRPAMSYRGLFGQIRPRLKLNHRSKTDAPGVLLLSSAAALPYLRTNCEYKAKSMAEYHRNKIRTAWEIYRDIENWPVAFQMRFNKNRPGLRLLNFRSGLNVACRNETRDWDVVYELYFVDSYGSAMEFLKKIPGRPVVLDLGGNIGLFSLLAAQTHPGAEIYSYEPGPPNHQMFELNCLANPALAKRIHLVKEAVAGKTQMADWFFDEQNPAGSTLFATTGVKYPVQIRAFAEVVKSLPGEIALAKIDIEGAEYELLESTPPETWERINAISLELHDSPGGLSRERFMERMKDFGYTIRQESVINHFLYREP